MTTRDHRTELVKSSGSFVGEMKLVWALLNDPAVSGKLKLAWWIVVGGYMISPMGIWEDFATAGAGVLDDVFVIGLAAEVFKALCPKDVVERHRRAILGEAESTPDKDYVDAEFREVKD